MISRKFAHANDLALLHSSGNWKDLEGTLSQDMSALSAYLQTWRLKLSHTKTVTADNDSAKNFFNLVHRMQQFPYSKICSTVLKVVQRNVDFAHSENVLLGVLGDDDEEI